jgi:putative antitoxin of VapBC-like toxin-antitoxin system
MRTTIDIPDALLEEARNIAARDHTTVSALIEHGLRHALAERKAAPEFHLRKVTFKGEGLQPGVADGTWERIRDLIYEGDGA